MGNRFGRDVWFSGWRLWPEKTQGPVGTEYRQIEWIRPYRPGYLRVTASAVGLAIFFLPFLASMLVFLTATGAFLPRILVSASLALISCGLLILVGRLFAAGVYVNDQGLRIVTIGGMKTWPWDQIADVSRATGRVAFLGVRVAPIPGEVVVVTTPNTGPLRTPVTSMSLDFLGRSQSFDAAALAIERWWRDAGQGSKA